MQSINSAQRGAIFALAKKAGLDNDALHDVVRRIAERESITQLTSSQAISVIDHLRRLTNEVEPLGWATRPQRNKIYALCRALGWINDKNAVDLKRLEGFAKAQLHVERLAWVKVEQAGKLINALKSMAAGGRGERKKKGTAV